MQVNQIANYVKSIDPKSNMNKTLRYGVKIIYKTISLDRKDKEQKRIQFVVKTSYNEDQEGNLFCTLHRTGFSINGKRVTRLVDELAERCMQELYPFVFKVNRTGIMLGIENLEEINERWNKVLPGLKQLYTGDEANAYFDRVSMSISSIENFREAIKKDVFYYLFFLQQPIQDEEEVMMQLPLVPGERSTPFLGKQIIKKIKRRNRIQLDYNGIYAADKVRHKTKIRKGQLELTYIWDEETFSLRKMEGKCYVATGKERDILYKITRL